MVLLRHWGFWVLFKWRVHHKNQNKIFFLLLVLFIHLGGLSVSAKFLVIEAIEMSAISCISWNIDGTRLIVPHKQFLCWSYFL